MEMTKRCVEVAALTAFRNKVEKTKLEIMKPLKENEKTKKNYDVSFLINDLPLNMKLILLKPSKLDEVTTFSGASLSIKGRFIPPDEQNSDVSKDDLLSLCMEGPNKQSILLALQMIEHLMKDVAGPEEKTSSGQVEKVLVGMEMAPAEFNLRGQILGADGVNLQFISEETEAEVTLRGRGSGYEEPVIGKESAEPLHIRIQHERPEVVQAGRILALHLLETVKQEFDKYCSQQARLMVTPPPVKKKITPCPKLDTRIKKQRIESSKSDLRVKKKRTPSPKSDTSWSPTTHNEFMEYSDLEDSDVRLNNIPSSSRSNALSKGSCSVYPEANKPKPEGNMTSVYQKDYEDQTDGGTESDNTENPSGYVPWSIRRKCRGGRKSKMYRDKITKYNECLEKLHKGNLSPDERKEIIETLDYLKPRLTSWWGVKSYGDEDYASQYKKITEDKARKTEINQQKLREKKHQELQSEKQKQSSVSEENGSDRYLPRLSAPLLPLPSPMSLCKNGFRYPPPSLSRPPFRPPTLMTPGPRPPPLMGKPCYFPRPTIPSGRPTLSAVPVASQSSHGWPPNQPPKPNNPNCAYGPQGGHRPPQQTAHSFNMGSRWDSNQRPPMINSSSNEFSSGRLPAEKSPQNFHAPVSYPILNRILNFRRPAGQMQPRTGLQHPDPRWRSPPPGIPRPHNPQI